MRNASAHSDENDKLDGLEGAQHSGRGAPSGDHGLPRVTHGGQFGANDSVWTNIAQRVDVRLTCDQERNF